MKKIIRFAGALAVTYLLCALLLSQAAYAQKSYAISEIQGSKNISPLVREIVSVSGIVTARTRTGFFIQTPDNKIDADPLTSEGIFVFTKNEPPSEAAVGNLVTVTGTVEEFRPRSETSGLTVTELSMRLDRDTIRLLSKNNPLPKPIVLSVADFKSNTLDVLEKYEGMRVSVAEMTVISPTDGRVDIKSASSESNGIFYAVVKGIARPFREPGLDATEYYALDEKEREKYKADYPKLTLFDENPERLRIESAAQSGTSPLNIAAGTQISNITGVLHYSFQTYTILLDGDSKPAISKTIKASPLPLPTDRQFSIAGMNLESFFDDQDDPAIREDIVEPEAFQRRLKKISMAVRDYLRTPDVIGVVEAENLTALKRLAEKINADAVAAGKPNPKYEAYLMEGNDGRGIDNGFLVKSARVKVIELKQFGKDEKFENAATKEDNFLNDRPPLMVRASIFDQQTGKPFELTLIVNHLKSFLGYNNPKQLENVRRKKRLQAEFLARLVQDRLKTNPDERIVLLGDFNAYQFNDGVMDVIGTIKGNPAAKDAVLMPSDDLVNPDLTDLVDLINPKEKYSFFFDGNAQVLDHILVTESLKKYVRAFGFARLNADFPEIYRNDALRVERFADHDPAVAYFSFDQTAAGK